MSSLDIGIDLGTSNLIATDVEHSTLIREPAVVALSTRTGQVIGIGQEVYRMIGREPKTIQIVHPLRDGVISDFKMTEVMLKYLLKKICGGSLLKPRVALCVPSAITPVESRAVIDSAVGAGARKVYLIEEPVAAAIGAGVDISKPEGNLIVDIGGGTCDIAVLSLYGIVCKASLKVAGGRFDEALIRYIRGRYNLLIGDKSAEELKMKVGTVFPEEGAPEEYWDIKGRDLLTGLPKKIQISRSETVEPLQEQIYSIIRAVQGVLEKTPPELVGDIRTNGIILTGGGSLLHGLDRLMEQETHVVTRTAPEALECVAMGTAKSFDYLGKLFDGFVNPSTHTH
ncbi:rod shape-determining protein [Oscillospiraceae bacterium MB08-C2-2]|nr:rod shape-determining protein [Oscillospiraceae bacterium MB08-C2-2]